MNNPVSFITCLIIFLFSNAAVAQDFLKIAEDKDSKKDTKTYSIQSLDGRGQKVHIIPDYFNHTLRISCLKDTIRIDGYWGVPPEIHILNKNFIKIEYAVRGGSGFGLGNILILCVNNNKLNEAMHALRFSSGESGDEQDDYSIKVALEGNTKITYKLNVLIHDKVNSKSNPMKNYTYNNQALLSFDVGRNVFYSIKEDIYDSFVVYNDPKTNKQNKQKIGGNFPVIILGKETYCCINGKWFELGIAKDLYEF